MRYRSCASILRRARPRLRQMWCCRVLSMRWSVQARSTGWTMCRSTLRGSLTRRFRLRRVTRTRCSSSLIRSRRWLEV
nr:hypothetical protein GZ27A8_16 [uncultured archaeon GZfos27A8]